MKVTVYDRLSQQELLMDTLFVPMVEGVMGVQAGHEPLIGRIVKGRLYGVKNGATVLDVQAVGGMIYVEPDRVRVSVDTQESFST